MPPLHRPPPHVLGGAFKLNRASPQARGLVGCWPLADRGGRRGRDYGGRNRHITLSGSNNKLFPFAGAPAYSNDGDSSSYGEFDASDISVIGLSTTTSAKTAAAWVWLPAATTDAAIYSIRDAGTGGVVFDLVVGANGVDNSGTGRPSFLIRGNDFGGIVWFSGGAGTEVNDASWHHIAVTRTPSGGLTLYRDGVSIATTSHTLTDGVYPTITPQVRLGDEGQNGAIPNINGAIRDLRLYNVALTAAEMRNLYARPWDLYAPSWQQDEADVVAAAAGGMTWNLFTGLPYGSLVGGRLVR